MEETGVPGENHPPAASHWEILSHNVAWAGFERTALVVRGTDWIGSYTYLRHRQLNFWVWGVGGALCFPLSHIFFHTEQKANFLQILPNLFSSITVVSDVLLFVVSVMSSSCYVWKLRTEIFKIKHNPLPLKVYIVIVPLSLNELLWQC